MLRRTICASTLALAMTLSASALATARLDRPAQDEKATPAAVQLANYHKKRKPPGLAKKKAKHRKQPARHKAAKAYRKGGPPPWAPAHGYRYKHGAVYSKTAYVAPFGIASGTCNKQEIGTALGAVAGGVIAAKVADGDRKKLAILGGVVLGAIVGNVIGKSMDDVDQACVGSALEHAGDGEKVRWTTQNGNTYTVVPQKTVQSATGRYCREYSTVARIAGVDRKLFGTACRLADGTWQLVN